MERNRQALQQSGRPAHAGLPEWTLRLTSAGGPFLDVEVDRASISAELAGLEELMRRLEKHRESDIMASDPRSIRKPDHALHQGLRAEDRSSRLPSSRCGGTGQEGSCGLSSTSASVSCSSWSSCSFAVRTPRRSSSSLCATRWRYSGARWHVPPTSPPIAHC